MIDPFQRVRAELEQLYKSSTQDTGWQEFPPRHNTRQRIQLVKKEGMRGAQYP